MNFTDRYTLQLSSIRYLMPRAADMFPCILFASRRGKYYIFFNVPLNKLQGINIGRDRRRLYTTVIRSLNALYSAEFV